MIEMDTPIPNVCKTQELDKCKKYPCFGPKCKEISTCPDHIPLYLWREVSEYYTCPKCYAAVTWEGCSECDPEGYNKAREYAMNPTHDVAIFCGNKKIAVSGNPINDKK